MTIEDDIRASIDKHLSAEVGTVLKKRLENAVEVENNLKAVLKRSLELEQALVRKEELLQKHSALDTKTEILQKLLTDTKEATVDKRIVDLTLEFAKQRVEDMKTLVLAVFQNNQYKYMLNEGGTVPAAYGPQGQSPFPVSVSRTVTAEGVGAPPPPPSSGGMP